MKRIVIDVNHLSPNEIANWVSSFKTQGMNVHFEDSIESEPTSCPHCALPSEFDDKNHTYTCDNGHEVPSDYYDMAIGMEFGQKCFITNQGMNKGYVINEEDGTNKYIKHESSLIKYLREVEYLDDEYAKDLSDDFLLAEAFQNDVFDNYERVSEDAKYIWKSDKLVEINS